MNLKMIKVKIKGQILYMYKEMQLTTYVTSFNIASVSVCRRIVRVNSLSSPHIHQSLFIKETQCLLFSMK